jgi:hypothetical protein
VVPSAQQYTANRERERTLHSTSASRVQLDPSFYTYRHGYHVLPIAELRQRIRRELFRSIADLQTAINRYLKEHNDDPKPFVWTKPADVILAKLDRLPVLFV